MKKILISLLLIISNQAIGYESYYLLSKKKIPQSIQTQVKKLIKSLGKLDWENPANGEFTATISDPYAKWYTIEDGYQTIAFEFMGCYNENSKNMKYSYSSKEEALAENCLIDSDVSWSFSYTFNMADELIITSDYWEWSGH